MVENGCRTVCRNSLTANHPVHVRHLYTHILACISNKKGYSKERKNPHIPTHTCKQLIYLSTTFLWLDDCGFALSLSPFLALMLILALGFNSFSSFCCFFFLLCFFSCWFYFAFVIMKHCTIWREKWSYLISIWSSLQRVRVNVHSIHLLWAKRMREKCVRLRERAPKVCSFQVMMITIMK